MNAFTEASVVFRQGKKDEIVVIAPQWAIEKLQEYYENEVGVFYSTILKHETKYPKYVGYDVLPGYEQKIIIFNKTSIVEGKNSFNYYEIELI